MGSGNSLKKTYSYQKNHKQIINIPANIEALFFGSSEIKESIHVYRVLAVILARIKGDELKNEKQLELFSEEFYFDQIEERDSLVGFHFKKSDFLPAGYTNFKPVEDAFRFLRKYKMDEKQRFRRSDGTILSLFTNFITQVVYEEKERSGRIYFEMGSYWYFRLRYGLRGFNKYLLDMFFKTNRVRTIKFYSYLLSIKKTSTLKIETFNRKFGTKYESYSTVAREYLEPIRREINSVSLITFGYHKTKEGHICIQKNIRKKALAESLEEYGEEKRLKTEARKKYLNKLNYLKRKHDLSDKDVIKIKSAFRSYDFEGLLEVTKNYKKRLHKELTGERFMEELVACMSDYMKNQTSQEN